MYTLGHKNRDTKNALFEDFPRRESYRKFSFSCSVFFIKARDNSRERALKKGFLFSVSFLSFYSKFRLKFNIPVKVNESHHKERQSQGRTSWFWQNFVPRESTDSPWNWLDFCLRICVYFSLKSMQSGKKTQKWISQRTWTRNQKGSSASLLSLWSQLMVIFNLLIFNFSCTWKTWCITIFHKIIFGQFVVWNCASSLKADSGSPVSKYVHVYRWSFNVFPALLHSTFCAAQSQVLQLELTALPIKRGNISKMRQLCQWEESLLKKDTSTLPKALVRNILRASQPSNFSHRAHSGIFFLIWFQLQAWNDKVICKDENLNVSKKGVPTFHTAIAGLVEEGPSPF